jgi:hypothetical protein
VQNSVALTSLRAHTDCLSKAINILRAVAINVLADTQSLYRAVVCQFLEGWPYLLHRQCKRRTDKLFMF